MNGSGYLKATLYELLTQCSQVDLLPKSEIVDSAAITCDAAGVTFLGGSGGMPPITF